MFKSGDHGETRFYLIIAIFVVIIVFFAFFFYNSNYELAYVHHDVLSDSWFEDIGQREIISEFFGIERYGSITYMSVGDYPSYLVVSTIKSPILLNEKNLKANIEKSLNNSSGKILEGQSYFSGERTLKNGHTSLYALYNGTDVSKYPVEHIKVIGEVWNCGKSGKSIICIGVSQITENSRYNTSDNLKNWGKIISDETGTFANGNFIDNNGLIYNVICH